MFNNDAVLTENTQQRYARLSRLARNPGEHRNLVRLLAYYHRLDQRFRALPEQIPAARTWGVIESAMHIVGDLGLNKFDNAYRTAISGWFR